MVNLPCTLHCYTHVTQLEVWARSPGDVLGGSHATDDGIRGPTRDADSSGAPAHQDPHTLNGEDDDAPPPECARSVSFE